MTTLHFTPVAGAIFPSQDAPGIPPLADFSPEVVRDLAAEELDRREFAEALSEHAFSIADHGMTKIGQYLYENYMGIEQEVEAINEQARIAFNLDNGFRNTFAMSFLEDVRSRVAHTTNYEQHDDSERDEPECHQFYSPEPRA